jgi:O-antigen/teichoic acid export membrane protein
VTPPSSTTPPGDLPAPFTGPDAESEAADALAGPDVGGRVVRGGAVRVAGIVAQNLLVALGAVVLLRYLGIDDFGRFGTVMALIAIVQGVTDAGLTITGTRELALREAGHARHDLLGHILSLRIALTSAGVVAAVLFALGAGYDEVMVVGTAVAGIAALLLNVQGAFLLPLVVELRNGLIAINEVLRQLFNVVFWALAVVAGAGLGWFFGAQVAAGVLMLALVPVLIGRAALVRPRWTAEQLRGLITVGLPVAISSVLIVVYFKVLIIIVSLLSTESQTGLFATSARIFDMTAMLPLTFSVLILPVLTVAARDDEGRLRYVLGQMTQAMAVAGVGVAIAVAVLAEPVLLVLGGEDFVDAAPILRVQCVALATLFVASAWSPTLIAMGRQVSVAVASGIGLLAVIVLGVALVPGMDAQGAAVAAAIADILLLAALYVLLRRAGPGRDVRLGFLARLLPLTALALAVGLGLGLPDLAGGVAAIVLFAAGALLLRLVPHEVLDAARRRTAPAAAGE